MKKCPFCAEDIQDEAVKCRYCGEFLKDNLRLVVGQKPEWYFKTSTLIIGNCMIGPLIIPVIWYNPRYSMNKKIILTVIELVIWAIIIKIVIASLIAIKPVVDSYRQMLNI